MLNINEEKIEKLKQKQKINNLNTSQETQDKDITDLMLATAEICEMVLSSQQTSTMSLKNIKLNEGGSSMAAIYVGLIERGLKTIDQVPVKYREEVRKMCEALEISLS
ncbi:CD1375 family protein [Clostridioides difficile]|uniref:CD1375 family protein n=1 Tax=Clostridioides difficile TaxID=1496 RepID=UPI000D1E2227|nr:CD1375 family protein [Clostridioides difficile]